MAKTTSSRIGSYCAQCYVPTCDFRGPCRFPHGCCYSTLAILSGVGGMLMNLYVLGSCFFMRVQLINNVTGDAIPGSERGYGFLSREVDYGIAADYKQCIFYPEAEFENVFDGWTHVGRVFAFFSAILSVAAWLVLLLTCCIAFSPSMFERWLFWTYIAAAICIALSFFAFGSAWCGDNICSVADGSGWAISAFMFHLVSANTVKSFAGAGARKSRGSMEDEDAHDEELDDLYYEREEDKYPPAHPNGPRGILVHKNGAREYDNGEDYYDDVGRMFDPQNERRAYRKAKKVRDDASSDGLLSADLDGISDHDLEQYASDSESDDEDEEANEGNRGPVFDPAYDNNNHGNLGVGYEEQGGYAVDEFGNPVDQFGNPLPLDEFGNPMEVDEYGNPFPNGPVDQFGNPLPSGPPVDEFGNPMQEYDDYGNPIQYADDGAFLEAVNEGGEEEEFDEFGNPVMQGESLTYT